MKNMVTIKDIARESGYSVSTVSRVVSYTHLNIMAEPALVQKCVDETGIGFMFAQLFNKSMKYVGQARKEMGIRTVFNILGPLANPSRAKNMVVGVYSPALTEKIAKAMSRLGVERGFVISGNDNMDEFTLSGTTTVSEIDGDVYKRQLFVLHGIIMSGETGWHRVKTPLTGKKFRSVAFFNNKIRAECELYCFDNMVLQQVIREWRLG